MDDSGRKFSGLSTTIGAGVRVLAGMFTTVAAGAAGVGAAVLRVGLDYNKLQQTSRAALTTLLGSAEAANAQMDRLDEFARTSPFAKQVFITAQQQLLGFGVEAEKVLPTLDAIQNTVAAFGGSAEDISAITDVMARLQSQGRLSGEALERLGYYGVDAAKIIGEQMGLTSAEIKDMASKPGGIPVDQIWQPLVNGLMERFGGATDNIKIQFVGATDRIKAAWRDLGGIVAAPFIDPQGGGRAVEWANKIADMLRALGEKAGPLVEIVVNRLEPAFDKVGKIIDRVRGGINAWDLRGVNGQLDTLTGYAPLIAGVSGALITLGGTNPLLMRLGISGINPVVAGIAALVLVSPELRAAGREVLDALSPLVPVARDVGKQVADTAMVVLRELTPALRDLLLAAAPIAVTFGQHLGPATEGLIRTAEPLVRILAEVVGWVADLPTPVLAAAAAFLLLHGPLNTTIRALGTGMSGALGAARDTWQASQGVAQALGRDVGFMGTAAITARAGVSTLGTALKTAFLSNPVGIAIMAVTTALGAFAAASADAKARANSYSEAVDEMGRVTEDVAARIAKSNLVTGNNANWGWYQSIATGADSAADAIENLGLNLDEVSRIVVGPQDDFDILIAQIREMGDGRGVDEIVTKLYQQRNALADTRHEAEQMGPATDDMADATDGATGAIEEQNDAWRDNIDLTREAADQALSLREAQLRAEDGQVAYTEAVERYHAVMDDTEATEQQKAAALNDLEQQLLSQVRDYDNVTEAMGRNNASAADLDAVLREQRDAFISNAEQMGLNADEARRLADQYGLIPNRVFTEIIADADEAQRVISRFITDNTGRTIRVRVEAGVVSYNFGGGNSAVANGGLWNGAVRAMAGGGFAGDGTPVPRGPMMARGGTSITWAEPETGWEAYISGKPSMRVRNVGILAEAADRLGYVVMPKAAGGYASGHITPAQAPAPMPFPDTVRLDRESVAAVTSAILAGAEMTAGHVVSVRERALAGARTTPGQEF